MVGYECNGEVGVLLQFKTQQRCAGWQECTGSTKVHLQLGRRRSKIRTNRLIAKMATELNIRAILTSEQTDLRIPDLPHNEETGKGD